MSTHVSTQGRVSIRAYARLRGVSDAAVRKWIAAGKMPSHADGIDVAEADAAVEANRTGSQVSKLADAAMQTSALPGPALAPAEAAKAMPASELSLLAALPGMVEDAHKEPTRADAERELASIKVERNRLALERDKAELIAVADAQQAISEVIEAAKNELLLMPDRLKERLAPKMEPAEVESVLQHEIRLALERLVLNTAA